MRAPAVSVEDLRAHISRVTAPALTRNRRAPGEDPAPLSSSHLGRSLRQRRRRGGPPGPPRPLGSSARGRSDGARRTTIVIRAAIGRRRAAIGIAITRAHLRHRSGAPATRVARAIRRRRGWVRRPTPTAPWTTRIPSYGRTPDPPRRGSRRLQSGWLVTRIGVCGNRRASHVPGRLRGCGRPPGESAAPQAQPCAWPHLPRHGSCADAQRPRPGWGSGSAPPPPTPRDRCRNGAVRADLLIRPGR